jgi:hypothetical protein
VEKKKNAAGRESNGSIPVRRNTRIQRARRSPQGGGAEVNETGRGKEEANGSLRLLAREAGLSPAPLCRGGIEGNQKEGRRKNIQICDCRGSKKDPKTHQRATRRMDGYW